MADSTAREIAERLIHALTFLNDRAEFDRILVSALADAEARVRQEIERVRKALSDPYDRIIDGLGVDSSEAAEGHMADVVAKRVATLEEMLDADNKERQQHYEHEEESARIIRALNVRLADTEALSARLATAEQALKDYGKHKADCGVYRYEDNIHEEVSDMYGCTCGLSAALGDPQ